MNIENFLNYAYRLCDNEDVISVYEELEKIMEDASLFLEQASLISCLYAEKKDINLWLKMGKIMKEKCNNNNFALKIYATFLKLAHPYFYENFKDTTRALNFNLEEIDLINENDQISCDLEKLVNRLNAILYMIVFLNQRKEYAGILELTPYVKTLDNEVQEYINDNHPQDLSSLDNLEDCKKHVSALLSTVLEIEELNRFAIYLDKNNKDAYVNVIYNLAFDNKEQEAQDFYKKEYLQVFKNKPIKNNVDIYWFLSDLLYARKLFYETVKCQKKAIEKEIAKI